MKYLFLISNLVLLYFSSLAQADSNVFKYLYDNSEIVIKGQITGNVGIFHAGNWTRPQSIVQIKIDSLYKGNPKLSTFKKAEYVIRDEEVVWETTESLGVCAHFIRNIYFVDTVSVTLPEQTAVAGQKVFVFLTELIDAPLGSRFNQPDDWYVYSLADKYLGMVTSNPYILEQLEELSKAKKE